MVPTTGLGLTQTAVTLPATVIQDTALGLLADFEVRIRARRLAMTRAHAARVEGDRDRARDLYRELVEREPSYADAWAGLAVCLSGSRSEALAAVARALAIDPASAAAHYAIGLLSAASEWRDVLEREHSLSKVPGPIAEGLDRLAAGDVDGAIDLYHRALSLPPARRMALQHLSVVCGFRADEAQAARWTAEDARERGAHGEAIDALERAIVLGWNDPAAHLALADSCRRLNRYDAALAAVDRALRRWPDDVALVRLAAEVLQVLGRTREAVARLRRAIGRGIGGLVLKKLYWLMVPVVYEREGDIPRYRRRYQAGLTRLVRATELDTVSGRREALEAVLAGTSVYLSYQNEDDRALQKRLGEWIVAVMTANYPDWAAAPCVVPTRPGERIRIGYASADCRRHSTANTHLGWLRHADRSHFDVHCYHLGHATDVMTDEFRQASDHFRHLPDGISQAARAIRADGLHVLVYLDVHLHPRVTALAALRLAPVQCTTWGHPVTSGLATMDYYLTSDLMERPGAESHYTETLVRLPGTGESYERPATPAGRAPRGAFKLAEDDVVYFCGQSPYKYTPRHDALFVEIARRVPRARLVFLETHAASPRFFTRLRRAFAHAGLEFDRSCVVLPALPPADCLQLMTTADIFLDSIGWSAHNTAFEAVAAGLPIVACPGPWMRGRHSLAVIETLGELETVAADETAYVAIAVRLGIDWEWREEIAARTRGSSGRLSGDRACVRALESFYARVAAGARAEAAS